MQTLLHLLPLALAVAFSTVPILAALVILLSPNRSRAAIPFLIGWVGGMFGVVVLATALAQAVPTSRVPRREEEAIGTLEIIVGAALILVGLWTLWLARRRTEKTVPAWLRSVEKVGPITSFGLALVLNLRPKSLLLAIAAGLALRADTDSTADALLAIAVYTVIGASTVAVPIIATVAAPATMEPRLIAGREWLLRHGDALTSGILILVGLIVILIGVDRL